MASWLQARAASGEWLVRMEDLDRVTSSPEHEANQLAALSSLGLHSDAPVVRQSERFPLYHDAIATLQRLGRVYDCYCSRREIREAAQAPHGEDPRESPSDAYPGTCRELTTSRLAELRRAGRPPALRLRSAGERFAIDDLIAGHFEGEADDVVIQRNDGVPAYNLAVVVDDAAQSISHVTRGGDLLTTTPRQRLLQQLLKLPEPCYAHVPLVVGPDGLRLAKRHGAVTLADLAARGISAPQVLEMLMTSLNTSAENLAIAPFRIEDIPQEPWLCTPTSEHLR